MSDNGAAREAARDRTTGRFGEQNLADPGAGVLAGERPRALHPKPKFQIRGHDGPSWEDVYGVSYDALRNHVAGMLDARGFTRDGLNSWHRGPMLVKIGLSAHGLVMNRFETAESEQFSDEHDWRHCTSDVDVRAAIQELTGPLTEYE